MKASATSNNPSKKQKKNVKTSSDSAKARSHGRAFKIPETKETGEGSVVQPPDIRGNKRIIYQLEVFFDLVPPDQLKKELLDVFVLFLTHEHETLPGDFKDVAAHYYLLFQLLDTIDEELTNSRCRAA